MSKLTRLTLSLPIALWAYQTLSTLPTEPPYLRDSLIFATIAGLLFLCNAPPLPNPTAAPPPEQNTQSWPQTGRAISFIGITCAFFGCALFVFDLTNTFIHILRLTLWALGLTALLVGLVWPPSKNRYTLPRYRWQRDADGRFVRVQFTDEATPPEDETMRWQRWESLALGTILAIGALPRLSQLSRWPADCVGEECVAGLRLMQAGQRLAPTETLPTLFDLTTTWLYSLTASGLLGLRLTSALIGTITLLAFYLLARQVVRPQAGLLATILLALSPWHILISRSSTATTTQPLLLALWLWACLHAYRKQSARSWAITGATLGLCLFEAPSHWPWLTLGATLILVSALLAQAKSPKGRWLPLLLIPPAFVLAAPKLLARLSHAPAFSWPQMPAFSPDTARILFDPLVKATDQSGPFFDAPLLDPLTGALCLLGFAYLLRHLFRPIALFITTGLLLSTLALLDQMPTATHPAEALLPLVPFLFLLIAITIDATLHLLEKTWSPLIRPAPITATAMLLVLLINGPAIRHTIQALATHTTEQQDPTGAAIGHYLRKLLQDGERTGEPTNGPTNATIFAPATLLENPQTRLLVGPQIDSPQVRPLHISGDFLAPALQNRDQLYLLPTQARTALSLLQVLYPYGEMNRDIETDSTQTGTPLVTTYHVAGDEFAKRRGLWGRYFQGANGTTTAEPALTRIDGSLHFPWATEPPLAPPFRVQWQGSLLIPAAGEYHFAVKRGPNSLFSLYLDNVILLDSSLGVTEKRLLLAEGVHHIQMRYGSDAQIPADLSVQWQPPNGQWAPIPPTAFYSDPVPNIGLLGTYFMSDSLQGPALTQRKDMQVGIDPNLPEPYSVRWQGKLAAARSGEYLLGLLTEGHTRLFVAGQPLIDQAAPVSPSPISPTQIPSAPSYAEGVIYLAQGWHDIEIHHIPNGHAPQLQLFWQPPGSHPSQIPIDTFAPIRTDIQPTDHPYPSSPALVDEQLGDADFALTQAMALRAPQQVIPPQTLPPLGLSQQWRVDNGCGDGDDQLDRPHGLAIGSLGQLYVADSQNRRILHYAPTGRVEAIFTDPRFQEPYDIEVMANGDLLILDAVAESALFLLDPATGVVEPAPYAASFYRPRGLAVDDVGNIYIADTGQARIIKLDPTGKLLAQFGGQETLLGKGQPVDVVVNNGVAWAITAEDGRLWRLEDEAGVTVVQPFQTVDGAKMAALPTDTVGSVDLVQGSTLFLTDPANGRLLALSKSGQPLAQSAYAGAFTTPTGIGATHLEGAPHLAVVDSQSCTLSLWQITK